MYIPKRAIAVIAGMIAASVNVAAAQDFYAGNIQSALNTGSVTSLNITRSDVVEEERQGRSRAGVAADAGAVLSPGAGIFWPVPEISARVDGRFVDIMSRGQPGKRGEIAGVIDGGGLRRDFERLMRSHGFDPRNVADVVAAYYIVMWQVVHDQVPTAGQIRGTRGRIVSGLARKRELAAMSDAQKQEAAETLTLLAALALRSYEDFKRRGDLNGLVGFQTVISALTRKSGVDIAQLVITDQGFRRQ